MSGSFGKPPETSGTSGKFHKKTTNTMKKTYITPATAIFEMRHENVIATTIPKDNSGEGIGDGNQSGFDFAPKDDDSWTDGSWTKP